MPVDWNKHHQHSTDPFETGSPYVLLCRTINIETATHFKDSVNYEIRLCNISDSTFVSVIVINR